MRDGVFKGISQAGQQNINVIIMLLDELVPLSNEFNVQIVRHLKHLVGIFVNILSDPFTGVLPRLVESTCEALVAVMNNGWPRVEGYKYDILRGVINSWQSQSNETGQKNTKVLRSLQNVIVKLENIFGKDNLLEDYTALIGYDNRLTELFDF
ncbi:hypothetical protein AWJ20_1188 [Sugiyamaella lignohabitans]|uniref:Uncharacterized protein n=1 Tax=Sugiyamaella lignohabitans TaxID=796027 RepID=A0A167DH10_9ASCO|nr:uncharacterized protein AWJ20_1188 [Sugiyamaella lignohabitans]ANB12910.1 hypothetical protein AWJ20_1188 [Sugiyamaella lignohabitans]